MERPAPQSCPKCLQQVIGTFLQHFQNYCLQRSSIFKLSDKVAVFVDQTYVCGRCLNLFPKDKWEYHQRKIRTACTGFNQPGFKQFTPTKSFIQVAEAASERDRLSSSQRRQFSQSMHNSAQRKQASSISQNRLFSSSFFSERQTKSERITLTKEITEDETILLLLLNLLDAKSKIPLLDWVKNNRSIKSIYLQEFFEKFLEKTFCRLRAVIKVPTFEMLEEKSALKWKSILKSPEDIFSQDIILESVKRLSASRKNKVLKCLNSIYNSFYADVFPKFNIEAIEPKKKRLELPLRTKDFFKILEQLFASKEKDLVHIGIDLYLIFQSAQRLVSDMNNIIKGVQQLMIDRKTDPTVCQLEMDIKKTRKSGKFILSEQLCQLLEQFGWQGFYRNGKIYERMREIFGFPVYSIKKCIFTEFELQKTKNQQVDLQKLAHHGSLKVSLGYAKDGVQTNEKAIKDSLRVPNLRVCPISREVLYRFLVGRLRFRKHAKVYHDWLDRLKKKMHAYNKQLCDYYDSGKQADMDEEGNILFQESQEQYNKEGEKEKEQHKEDQMKSLLEDVPEEELVEIFGLSFSFKDKKFRFGELFVENTISYCQDCGLEFYDAVEQGVTCLICSEPYHSKCMPKFCCCILPKKFPVTMGIPFKSGRHNSLQLDMPEQYLNRRHQDKLDNIIFLLAARRFTYTPSPVLTENVTIDQEMIEKQGAQRISLAHFEEYQKGNYFPPVFLDKSGSKTTFGTGFGLFAAEDIEKDCFIGEYAADIVNGSKMIKIKRYDSVMTLVEGTKPSNTIMIGPRDYCGYICLINGAKEQEANCSSRKVEINGFVRIIVFTHKTIKQGVQLCYNYDESSAFSKQGLKQKSHKPKQQTITLPKQPLKVPLGFHRRGLVNLGSSCYMYRFYYARNAVFQFLRIMVGDHLKEHDSSQVQQNLYRIIAELKKEEEAYDPKDQVNSIVNAINADLINTSDCFFTNNQADAREFFYRIMDKINEKNKVIQEMITGTAKAIRTCNKCHSQYSKQESFISLEKEMNEKRFQIASKEVQDVDYTCQVCSHKHSTKTVKITKSPEVLVLSLKRFTNNLSKNSKSVREFNTIPNYELKAVIIHHGTSRHSGHYVTEEYQDDFVCLLDDSKVTFIEKNQIESYGYIFGYRRNQ